MKMLIFFYQKLHTFKNHTDVPWSFIKYSLKKHCRICGKQLSKAKGKAQPVYSCTECLPDLAAFVGIDNCKDKDEQVFPQYHCHSRMSRVKKSKEDGFLFHSMVSKE